VVDGVKPSVHVTPLQQRILDLALARPGISIPDIAKELSMSDGWVRKQLLLFYASNLEVRGQGSFMRAVELWRTSRAAGAPDERAKAPTASELRSARGNESSDDFGAFKYIDVDTSYHFLSGRVPAEAVSTCTLQALVDGLEVVHASYAYHADPNRDAVEYEVLEGGEVEHLIPQRKGFYRVRIRLPRPLQAGEIHRLREIRRIKTSVDSEPYCFGQYARPVDRYTVRIQFARPAFPVSCWYFDEPYELLPGTPTPLNKLDVDRLGHVEMYFKNLEKHRCYGIAWQW